MLRASTAAQTFARCEVREEKRFTGLANGVLLPMASKPTLNKGLMRLSRRARQQSFSMAHQQADQGFVRMFDGR